LLILTVIRKTEEKHARKTSAGTFVNQIVFFLLSLAFCFPFIDAYPLMQGVTYPYNYKLSMAFKFCLNERYVRYATDRQTNAAKVARLCW